MRKLIIAVLAVMLLVTCKPQKKPVPQQTAAPPAQGTAQAPAQTVDINISGGDYLPASVTVAKGQPVRLNFTRDAKPTCGETVIFPTLNVRKDVPVGQVVSIDISPQQSGELNFTCGMNMMRGTVVVQ